MEFQAIYDTMNKVRPMLEERKIPLTVLHPKMSFEYKMFDKPVNGKNGFHYGYSWCGGKCRWGTTDKLKIIADYTKNECTEYIGIAADETKRLKKERKGIKIFPLADIGMTEKDCLQYCYDRGFYWEEHTPNGTVRLYDILDRVSCWCCANKNLKELKNIYTYLPQYWEKLKELQSKTERPMKGPGKSVFELESRFSQIL